MHSFHTRLPAVLFLILACLVPTQAEVPRFSKAETVMDRDIVYRRVPGMDLALDLARPVGQGPFPVLIMFGGNPKGFFLDTKRTEVRVDILQAAQNGFVAVAPDIHPFSRYPFPTQIHDAKAVVRWIRQNAAAWQMDPDRIGVMGRWSGGWLALMLGLTGPEDGLEGEGADLSVSSAVRAVVNLGGASDMALYFRQSKDSAPFATFLGGGPETNQRLYEKASPSSHVTHVDPPVMSMYWMNDTLFTTEHGSILARAFQGARILHVLWVSPSQMKAGYYDETVCLDFLYDRMMRPRWVYK